MINGLGFAANFTVTAGRDGGLTGDGEAEGEDTTTVVAGRASANLSP